MEDGQQVNAARQEPLFDTRFQLCEIFDRWPKDADFGDFCWLLNVNRSTVWRWIQKGNIPRSGHTKRLICHVSCLNDTALLEVSRIIRRNRHKGAPLLALRETLNIIFL